MKTPKASKHDSSVGHVTGTSEFIDDILRRQGELLADIFYSPVASANIKSLKLDEALKIAGVVKILTYKDLHHNRWGSIVSDQPLLAETEVFYAGEPIAVIVATTKDALMAAKKSIQLELEEKPNVLNIKKAVETEFLLGEKRDIRCGDVKFAMKKSTHSISGTFESGGQEQFYLESQAAIAFPDENNNIKVLSSSQHPTEVQHIVAHALGLAYYQVICEVKRMGGAFGGKESQSSHIAALTALAAQKTQRPVRMCLTKDDDMKITGKRHPFQNNYKVGFDDNGKILALKVDFYCDGGAYTDLSPAILQRAMFHLDNAYFIPNAEISGQIYRTHTAANTAFRGFGGPQGVATIENIIEEIAQYLKKDAFDLRKLNCYQGTNLKTPYGQVIENNMLPELFDGLADQCNYRQRVKEIEKFNSSNETHLKGISITAVKFGISFTSRFLNQGNALVNVHRDGSVQVSTGATEMGQGVNTKIQNIVSECFGISNDVVRVMTTSTEKNHNTSATAASSGSDINGAAALNACEKIKDRLSNLAVQIFGGAEFNDKVELSLIDDLDITFIEYQNDEVFSKDDSSKKMSFSQLVDVAFHNRVSAGDYGFYKTQGIFFDKKTGQGHPFLYFTNGVAASEVIIDKFTGEVKVLQTDILMDLGRSINKAVDYGQTTGGFIQGMGWVTNEALVYDENGMLVSCSPTTYKIPNIQDTPRVFNVDFIKNETNTKNVKASKAVGEPPLLLGISVWTAIKSAIQKNGDLKPGKLKLPATPEEILNHIYEEEL